MSSVSRRVSAASARAHTRKGKSGSRSAFSGGVLKKVFLLLIVGFIAWAYKAIQPPPPNVCGTPDGPPVTAPRIRLSDGRYLAYMESGVTKEEAKYKIISVHGFLGSRLDSLHASKELVDELGVYIVSFDRAGYGESDPHPTRTIRTEALDIEELADQLGLGPKFYVISFSIGGRFVWGCLKYIPHRLAGAALIAPVINYWWPSFPANLSREAYYQQLRQDQWALGVAHYTPWLTYWWMTQKWFPSSSVIHGNWKSVNRHDNELRAKFATNGRSSERLRAAMQQGVFESLHRDMMIMFGKWEFDPMDLENPFPNNEGAVHLWQGDEDALVPHSLQRYICKRLPWIRYHELPGMGHLLTLMDGFSDRMLKTFLLGEEFPITSS